MCILSLVRIPAIVIAGIFFYIYILPGAAVQSKYVLVTVPG